MANPIWSWLRGDDFKTTGTIQAASRVLVEQKAAFTPSSANVDWEYVNHLIYTADPASYGKSKGDGNAAVFSCLMTLAKCSIEPPLRVFRRDTKTNDLEPLSDHPLQEYLDEPNPWLDEAEIRFWLAWAKHVDGNAYLLKVRSGDALRGNVVQHWPISPLLMCPWTEKGSRNFIDYYRYETAPGVYEGVPVENVVHFRMGIDDRDMRKGMSGLKRLLRQIATDAEVTAYAAALLGNFAAPGLVVTPPADSNLTEEQALALKERIGQSFGTENRGKVGVLTGGATMQQFGFNPEQLNLEGLHDMPQAEIAAVLGCPPILAGLSVGLKNTSNFATTMKQVRENFTELTLVPWWRMDEAKWNKWLKPDFTRDKSIVVKHDLSEVRALQEDEDTLHKRTLADYHGGVISLQKARMILGEDPDWQPDELFAVPGTVTLTLGADLDKPPEPVPALPPSQNPDEQAPNDQPPAGKAFSSSQVDLSRWPELMDGLRELAVPSMADDLDTQFDGTRRRVKRALMSS